MDSSLAKMKILILLLIMYVESKRELRSFVLIREAPVQGNPVTGYLVYNANEKELLYRMKTSSSNIDTVILVDQPTKNMVANLEGEWLRDVFEATFAIYDPKTSKWLDGSIQRSARLLSEKYTIVYEVKRVIMKSKALSKTVKIYDAKEDQVYAQFRMRTQWFGSKAKYDLKVYSNEMPDAVYFFALAIIDHRTLARS